MEKEKEETTRRDWFSQVFMWGGLVLSYGTLAIFCLAFLLPKRVKPKTRKLFAGLKNHYEIGAVQSFYDLQGNEILVKRNKSGFEAFRSDCPHLGCKVHWQADKQQFFCPCHRGVFDADGKAISGPPADAGQNLYRANLDVDDSSGVVYIEVRDV